MRILALGSIIVLAFFGTADARNHHTPYYTGPFDRATYVHGCDLLDFPPGHADTRMLFLRSMIANDYSG